MSDNVAITAGAGTTIAADNISGALHQRMKLTWGTDGSAVDASATNPLPITQAAGELHLGEVGGKIVAKTATPTVSTTPAYAAGDALGGKLTLTNAVRVSGGSGTINTVVISDLGKQNAPIDVIFFSADPSGTTFTDNSALDVADADLLTIIGVVSVTTWTNFNDNSVGVERACGLDVVLAGTSLYACLVNRGTPTYAATTDIQVTVVINQN